VAKNVHCDVKYVRKCQPIPAVNRRNSVQKLITTKIN